MFYTIQNDHLKVTVNSLGAELHSIQSEDGTEYLWQGNPDVWDGQAPNIFPYVARLTEQKYTYDGNEYTMKIHGFINAVELTPEKQTKESITLRYDSNEETLAQYPFSFIYRITYALKGNVMHVTNEVENLGSTRMHFGIGGHPGFNVPLEDGLSFEDYCLEFSHSAHPYRVGFTADCFLNGSDAEYPLVDGTKIPLHHDLFDDDAIVLKHTDHTVTLHSEKGNRAVRVSFPDYNVIGFWHMPKIEAPYVCIEPWSSLPSRKGIIEDFGQQADLIALDGGKTYRNEWAVEIIG